MQNKIIQIVNYNVGQAMEFLETYNIADNVKRGIKNYMWRIKDEISFEFKKSEVENGNRDNKLE